MPPAHIGLVGCGLWGRAILRARFVRDRYSVERAADAYALLYADRTVTTESLLQHYSQAVHLGSEVRRWASARYRRLTRPNPPALT